MRILIIGDKPAADTIDAFDGVQFRAERVRVWVSSVPCTLHGLLWWTPREIVKQVCRKAAFI